MQQPTPDEEFKNGNYSTKQKGTPNITPIDDDSMNREDSLNSLRNKDQNDDLLKPPDDILEKKSENELSWSKKSTGCIFDLEQDIQEYEWGNISQPDATKVLIRSKNYLQTREKIYSKEVLLPLVACECWRVPFRIDNLASHPSTWYSKNCDPEDPSVFFVIFNLQVTSVNVSFISYHVLDGGLPANTEDKIFNSLFMKFLHADKKWKDRRLKFIPKIVNGPFLVRKSVENKPVLLGTKVTHRYTRGKNYLEVDSQVDDSALSRGILKLCHTFARRIVVEMNWVIQGNCREELCERIMLGVTVHHLDFSKVEDIEEHRKKLEKESEKEDSAWNNAMNDSKIEESIKDSNSNDNDEDDSNDAKQSFNNVSKNSKSPSYNTPSLCQKIQNAKGKSIDYDNFLDVE